MARALWKEKISFGFVTIPIGILPVKMKKNFSSICLINRMHHLESLLIFQNLTICILINLIASALNSLKTT